MFSLNFALGGNNLKQNIDIFEKKMLTRYFILRNLWKKAN